MTTIEARRALPATVDVIESSAYILDALATRLAEHASFLVRARASNWISYITEHPAPADVVVVRAELRDHVPAALKARAIAAEGSLPVVSLGADSETHRLRLQVEGAVVVERSAGLPALIERIVAQLGSPHPRPGPDRSAPTGPLLTDREMQIACLYSGRSAPSAPHLAEILGLREQTVRAHLKRCRSKLASAGWEISTRRELRTALERAGWLLPID